jgi:hypothetical protein
MGSILSNLTNLTGAVSLILQTTKFSENSSENSKVDSPCCLRVALQCFFTAQDPCRAKLAGKKGGRRALRQAGYPHSGRPGFVLATGPILA